jgi:hypothetical protein
MKPALPLSFLAIALALALPAAAFAQSPPTPGTPQAGTAPAWQPNAPSRSGASGTDVSGYGAQPGSTSDASSMHAARTTRSLSDWDPHGLFAHH